MRPARLAATRRTAIVAGIAGVVALTACHPRGEAPGVPSPTGPSAGGDPDQALVAQVLAGLAAAADLVGAVAVAHPGLAAPLHRLRDLHAAHIAVLEPAGMPSPSPLVTAPATPSAPGTTPSSPAAALRAVRRREHQLHGQLVDAAVAAWSGTLATVLAAMSAAVSQQLATLGGPAA